MEDFRDFVLSGCYFRMEGCALHVACRNFECARDLLIKARGCGWKRSGIISDKGGRFIVELFSTEVMAVPLVEGLSEEFLRVLVREANLKLERTWEKILRLEAIF